MAGYGKVTAPRRWRSSPDSPPTQLAYVTQPEIDLLVDADIHGSLKRGPNRGPQGIMSLDGGGGSYWGGGGGGSGGSGGSGGGGGGGGGRGLHWDPPPPVVTVPPPWVADPAPIVNIPDPVIETGPPPGEPGGPGYVAPPPPVEVWDEEDIDYLDGELVEDLTNEEIAAITGQTYNPDTGNIESYTPPEDIYGPGSAIPGETGYAYQNITPEMVLALGLDQIDPETAAFFGYDPGSTTVPNELYQQYIEGSIVSGNEAVETAHLAETGQNWPDYVDFEGNWVEGDPVDTNVGTWHDLVAGEHPLFPGGLEDYYEDMDDPFTIPINMPGGGPSVPEQVQRYGERRPSLAEMARHFWFSESLGDVEAKEAQREAEGLGVATMSNMDRMFAKDFSDKAMGPDPFYDPEFSSKYYEDYDPIYAGMDLFEKARS